MDEVRGLLEAVLADLLRDKFTRVLDAAWNFPVLPGEAVGERPDKYVSVVAEEADARARGVYLVSMEVRVVCPVDDAVSLANSRRWLRAIMDYLDDYECPFRTYASNDLRVCGFHVGSMRSLSGARSRADVIDMKVAAGAVV